MYKYKLKKNQYINLLKLSDVETSLFESKKVCFDQPVNLEEGHIHIVYPQKEEYIASFQKDEIKEVDYNNTYFGFENHKVKFSSPVVDTHDFRVQGEFFLEAMDDISVEFEIETEGALQIYLNGVEVEFYKPLFKHFNTKKVININLNKGINKVNIVLRDMLAKRETDTFYSIKYLSDAKINCLVDFKDDQEFINSSIAFLNSIYFMKDEFYPGEEIKIEFDGSLLIGETNINVETIMVEKAINKEVKNFDECFAVKNDMTSYNFGLSETYYSAVYNIRFSINTKDGNLTKTIMLTNAKDSIKFDEFEDRKAYLIENLMEQSVPNITKSLLLIANDNKNEDFTKGFYEDLEFIDKKLDCSDFRTVPLMWLLVKYGEKLTTEEATAAKNTMLNFRYWVDEPGNDNMWYFSENHSFLFHITQYLAGYYYPNDTFSISGKTGSEQYEIGRDRLFHWFENLKRYEFAEWNSLPYFPIDFIGFSSLYACAPDQELRDLAKECMDRAFDLLDMNMHHESVITTYGRVYEKELKTHTSHEVTLLTWLYWNKGYFNPTNRASAMLALTDYRHYRNEEYAVENEQVIKYNQGYMNVPLYIYKNKYYQMSTAINYRYKLEGHQQHIFNISFSSDEIQMWFNNPGEEKPATRYWAGNGILPQVYMQNNVALFNWENFNSDIKFNHMYFPTYKFEHYEIIDNMILVNHKGAYLGVISSSNFSMVEKGVNANREIIFDDVKGCNAVFLENEENMTFEEFKELILATTMRCEGDTSDVKQNGKRYLITNNQFYVNGEIQHY